MLFFFTEPSSPTLNNTLCNLPARLCSSYDPKEDISYECTKIRMTRDIMYRHLHLVHRPKDISRGWGR